MDLRVNQLQQPAQIEPKASVPESDGSFRFTLLRYRLKFPVGNGFRQQ